MRKKKVMKTFQLLLIALALAACSIEVSDVAPAITSPIPTQSIQFPTSAPLAATESPTAAPTPLPWASFNLSGSLIYTQGTAGINKLNLDTGNISSLLTPPANAWLTSATLSPDGKTIALAYSPPPSEGQAQLGYNGLYQMPADGSAATDPEPWIERADPQESYFSPAWSPDGKYVYFAHFIPVRSTSGNTFKYAVERVAYPGGKPEVVVEDAIWPRLTPDGTKLAYLSFDTESFVNDLYLANTDGTDAAPVMPPGTFPSVDAHFFSPDGQTIIFSAIGAGPSPALTWLDRLMGVQVAGAHNVPSDWWSITLGSDKPVRLTQLYDTGLYGDFSPDGQYVAFLGASGIHLMKPDGRDLTPLIPIEALGTLEWVP